MLLKLLIEWSWFKSSPNWFLHRIRLVKSSPNWFLHRIRLVGRCTSIYSTLRGILTGPRPRTHRHIDRKVNRQTDRAMNQPPQHQIWRAGTHTHVRTCVSMRFHSMYVNRISAWNDHFHKLIHSIINCWVGINIQIDQIAILIFNNILFQFNESDNNNNYNNF